MAGRTLTIPGELLLAKGEIRKDDLRFWDMGVIPGNSRGPMEHISLLKRLLSRSVSLMKYMELSFR